jgi:hypothetical protein
MKRRFPYLSGLLLALIFSSSSIHGWWFMNRKPIITIYIHGTRVIPHFLIKKLFHCTDGLHKASEINRWYQQRKAVDWISSSDPSNYPFESFYIFCWSGDLSVSARQKAAKKLYSQLQELMNETQKKSGSKPIIKLICHSHGSNVALSLAHYCSDKPDFAINELILLGCPVQEKTAPLIKSPLFKHIYSIYSTLDNIQWLDPQWFQKNKGNFFSQRVFKPQDNLKQIAIKINNWGIFHVEFLFKKFNALLPTIINEMKNMAHQGSSLIKHHILNFTSI